ncbi:MAG TPA: FAD-dependent oxidoreductase [Vicinamibacterales bacterium]|nr:FAD-dependent oxidoreductase [Vicinamibacterales bacterium]
MRLLLNDPATPTTRIVRLALEGEGFSYRAGQAAALAVERSEPTPYSIASAPAETARHGWLEFLIKVDGSSRFGARVADLRPGTTVSVGGATGNLTLPEPPRPEPLLFIAGGTGIAPMRSMICEALQLQWPGRLTLVYSARTPDEFAYLDELRILHERGALDLTLTLTGKADEWDHARGRTSAVHLSRLITPDSTCFLCGPPAMLRDVPDALASLGLRREKIRTEHW